MKTEPSIVFMSSPVTTTSDMRLDENLTKAKQDILDKIDRFTANGSGWVLDGPEEIDLVLSTYDPLRTHSYLVLPKKFKNAKRDF